MRTQYDSLLPAKLDTNAIRSESFFRHSPTAWARMLTIVQGEFEQSLARKEAINQAFIPLLQKVLPSDVFESIGDRKPEVEWIARPMGISYLPDQKDWPERPIPTEVRADKQLYAILIGMRYASGPRSMVRPPTFEVASFWERFKRSGVAVLGMAGIGPASAAGDAAVKKLLGMPLTPEDSDQLRVLTADLVTEVVPPPPPSLLHKLAESAGVPKDVKEKAEGLALLQEAGQDLETAARAELLAQDPEEEDEGEDDTGDDEAETGEEEGEEDGSSYAVDCDCDSSPCFHQAVGRGEKVDPASRLRVQYDAENEEYVLDGAGLDEMVEHMGLDLAGAYFNAAARLASELTKRPVETAVVAGYSEEMDASPVVFADYPEWYSDMWDGSKTRVPRGYYPLARSRGGVIALRGKTAYPMTATVLREKLGFEKVPPAFARPRFGKSPGRKPVYKVRVAPLALVQPEDPIDALRGASSYPAKKPAFSPTKGNLAAPAQVIADAAVHFFKLKKLKKLAGKVMKVAGKLGPIASFIPGVGPALTALTMISKVTSKPRQAVQSAIASLPIAESYPQVSQALQAVTAAQAQEPYPAPTPAMQPAVQSAAQMQAYSPPVARAAMEAARLEQPYYEPAEPPPPRRRRTRREPVRYEEPEEEEFSAVSGEYEEEEEEEEAEELE